MASPPSPKKPAVPVPATVKMLFVAAGAAGAHNNNAAAETSSAHQTDHRPRLAVTAEARILIPTSPF